MQDRIVLAIFGTGGQGREVRDVAEYQNAIERRWDEIVFIDDTKPKGQLRGTRVMPFTSIASLYDEDQVEFVVALGEPQSKKAVFDRIKQAGFSFANVVSPHTQISPYASLGTGIIIKRGAIVSPDATIGDNTTLQSYVTVGHDVVIGTHCQISTHSAIGGGTVIGNGTYVGLNCPIRENLSIGDNVVISAGAVVLRDCPANVTVMGNPARTISKNETPAKVFR